jgi:hypothetical protein
MKTFTMRDRKGVPFGDPVEYHPLPLVVGVAKHDLALHRSGAFWRVSHPATGAKVLDVQGSLYGARVTSRGLTLAEAREAARTQVLALADQIGAAAFNDRIALEITRVSPQLSLLGATS